MVVTTTMSEWLNRLETTDHEDPVGLSSEGTSSVACGTPKQDGPRVSMENSPPSATEVIIVAYQQFSVDYDLPDGTYTPDELRRSKLQIKPGMVMRYRLQWPNGIAQPPHPDSALRAKTEQHSHKSHRFDRQRGRSRAKTDL
jgi:hypothetical protein